MTCTGPYEIPNVKVDVDGVYTNNVPGGAFRGFGAPQGIFAAETQMNKLAQALGNTSRVCKRAFHLRNRPRRRFSPPFIRPWHW